VYLSEVDQFIKRQLKCRYYLRYVDDMVLLAKDKKVLREWCEAIQEFLREHLKLTLRPEMTTPFPVRRGIDFVGWKTWWNYRLPRRRTLCNLTTRLDRFEQVAVRTTLDGKAQRVDLRCRDKERSVKRLYSILASYSGHLRHGSVFKAWQEIWERRPWLVAILARQGWSFAERWPSRAMNRAQSLYDQYWPLARQAGEHSLIFFQFGRFTEFYGPQRLLASRILRLRPVAIDRAGFAIVAGFPTHLSEFYFRRAIRQSVTVMVVHQASTPGFALARRLPSSLLIPSGREINSQHVQSILPKGENERYLRPCIVEKFCYGFFSAKILLSLASAIIRSASSGSK